MYPRVAHIQGADGKIRRSILLDDVARAAPTVAFLCGPDNSIRVRLYKARGGVKVDVMGQTRPEYVTCVFKALCASQPPGDTKIRPVTYYQLSAQKALRDLRNKKEARCAL